VCFVFISTFHKESGGIIMGCAEIQTESNGVANIFYNDNKGKSCGVEILINLITTEAAKSKDDPKREGQLCLIATLLSHLNPKEMDEVMQCCRGEINIIHEAKNCFEKCAKTTLEQAIVIDARFQKDVAQILEVRPDLVIAHLSREAITNSMRTTK